VEKKSKRVKMGMKLKRDPPCLTFVTKEMLSALTFPAFGLDAKSLSALSFPALGLDAKSLSALLRNWKILAPCAATTVAALWMALRDRTLRSKYPGKKLPPVYNKGLILPVLGAAAQFLWDPLAMGARGHAAYGDIFTVHVFGKRLTFVCGPEAQEFFCKSRDEDLSQQEAYSFSIPLFGEGVVYGADPDRRAEQIKLVTSSLHTTALGNYAPMMLQEAQQYFDKWGNEGVVDIYSALSELIILTASRCLMGREVREQLYAEVSNVSPNPCSLQSKLYLTAPQLSTPHFQMH
jgi:hypothetical protein